MRKIGVILARLQPVHNGHLALIEKSINENDETYVFVGSANKFNKRNPLPISLRLQLLQEALVERFTWNPKTNDLSDDKGVTKYLYIIQLDDLTSEGDNSHTWGFYFYSKVVTATQCSNFTIYYSDGLPFSSPDEEKFGFSYHTLSSYIRDVEETSQEIKAKIEHMHSVNSHKLKIAYAIPAYWPSWYTLND